MNWMDVCVIIIIVVNSIRGLTLGLVLSVFNMASFIIAAVVSKVYFPKLSTFIIKNTKLPIKIYEFILNRIKNSKLQESALYGQAETNIFEIINFPKNLGDLFMKSSSIKEYNQAAMDNIHAHIAEATTNIIIDLLSIVVIFLGVLLVLNILGHILDGLASLPVISQFNRLGGLAFGLFKGVLVVFILLAIMVPVVSIFPDSFIVHALYQSSITKDLYNHNLLLKLLAGIIANSGYIIIKTT